MPEAWWEHKAQVWAVRLSEGLGITLVVDAVRDGNPFSSGRFPQIDGIPEGWHRKQSYLRGRHKNMIKRTGNTGFIPRLNSKNLHEFRGY